ncbi:MAG: NUDIX hydrolase [Lachnospiraceae bacterium]|nr:NUDIX hydrolase [Lachnospiraceae bacterium]
MSLLQEIKDYRPVNEQEACDKERMIQYMTHNARCLEREDQTAHFTASAWTVNKERTKTLMVYHNIYDSWSWIGGHADGSEDLRQVALRELQEETGVRNAALVSGQIFSLEILTVDGHVKKGVYVPGHLHLNVTYLAEADEAETLIVNEAENQAVKWWSFEDALKVPKEPWLVKWVYQKLIEKTTKLLATEKPM